MLVLSRKTNETIQISDNVSVTILRINGSSVRIGIDAPRHIRIVRGEISTRVKSVPSEAPNDQGRVDSPSPEASAEETSIDEDTGRASACLLRC